MYIFFNTSLQHPSVFLDQEESKHCIKVLRMRKHDLVCITDGNGTEVQATIIDDNPKRCELLIKEKILHPKASKYNLHVYVAPTKNVDRMEWFVEKAVECGLDSITFIETDKTERSRINLERLQKIAISAMKQSKQWHLPYINSTISWKSLMEKDFNDGAKFIAWCNAPEANYLPFLIEQSLNTETNTFHILIGPEGDFTSEEEAQANTMGFVPVSLGNTILRTETAALFSVMTVKSKFQ